MKKLFFYLTILFFVVSLLLVLRIVLHVYAYTHLTPLYELVERAEKDFHAHPGGRLFLYSKKFADLTGLDPEKSIDLPPGLEAIEFYGGRRKDPEFPAFIDKKLFYDVEDRIELHDRNIKIKNMWPTLKMLYGDKLGKANLASAEFKLYIDDDIHLAIMHQQHTLLDTTRRYPVFQQRFGLMNYFYEEGMSQLFSETDMDSRSVLLDGSVMNWLREKDKLKKDHPVEYFFYKHSRKDNDGFSYLENIAYRKSFLPGINYLYLGGGHSAYYAVRCAEQNAYVLLEILNEKNNALSEQIIWKSKRFYYFKLPAALVESDIYKNIKKMRFG
ncbi:MAG: hypothetical protein ACD_44C00155G0005 [uncultured bacterium]|nr:MAG: hypothetical protein ACD_44C00155G0005 [uncultured bacterium]